MDRGGGIPWGLNPIKTCSRFGKGGEENSVAVAAENKNEISAVSEGVRKLKMPRSGSSREKSEGSCSAAASGLPPLRRVAKSGENRNEISALSDSVSKLKMPQCSGENSEGYLSVAGSGLPPLRKTAKAAAAENRNEIYALSESVSKLKMPRSSGGENSEDCLSAAAFGLPPLRKTAKSDGRKKDVSSFQSSYHGESSSKIVFETEELKVFNGNTDFCSNIDNKGPVSPQMSGGQNLFKGQKSYSHELGPRGGMHPIYPRAHSDNDLKELVGVLHARFDVAKEEVNIELKDFAGELVDILEQNDVFSPECDEKVEDLLILARSCAMMSPTDFRSECEKVVQDLADRRQKMPAGYLKQLHTRMLFILTRCNRLLQFQKDSNWGHESSIHKFKQCLDGVPSVDINWKRRSSKKNKAGPVPNQFGKQDKDPTYIINKSIAETCSIDPVTLEDTMKRTNASFDNFGDALHDNQPNFASHVCSKSIESCNADSRNLLFKANHPNDKSDLDWNYHSRPPDLEKSLSLDTACKESSVSPVEEDSETVICRICEEMVPTSQLEPHSYLCACAERCDSNTFHVDERLLRMSEILEQVLERDTLNSAKTSIGSPEVSKMQSFSAMDGYESYSPKYNNEQYKVVEEMVEGLHEIDTVSIEDWKAPYLKSSSLLRFEQAFVPSSVGSLTPKSGMDSPKINQIDSFWLEHYNLTESEDFMQIAELAEIARCVANASLNEYKATESLIACMQDLQNLFQKSKAQALVIDTIGRRVEKLLREKYLLACEMLDQKGFDSADESHEEETALADDCSNRITSLLNPPQKDRITISDFELLKPISKGAFGKVFLARKLTTGDLFAIKVLRKMDMIRKNAVESILSERNILITVRNPFVVRFFYSFTCRDNLYLVMEFLNGGDLYSLLKNVGYLEEEVARVYIAELVLALEYLHSLGIVHRDLKPDNILIAHDGHIKLTDFGLSKLGLINSTDDLAGAAACESACLEGTDTDISSEEFHYTQERIKRSAVGTPDYLAPEILLGTEHGYTADWWSTGIVLFELLTGIPPFTAEHPQKIFDNILSRKIPWPRVPEEMSNDAKDLIEKLLVEDPNQRLGAKGAFEVKRHPFFSTINWDTLATQKAAFVPSPESADDTSYFASRHSHNSVAFQHYPDSSNYTTSSMSSDSAETDIGEGVDTCGDLTSFDDSSVNCSAFNNFSFKNLAQLASINYDLLSQSGKESSKSSSPSKSHDH